MPAWWRSACWCSRPCSSWLPCRSASLAGIVLAALAALAAIAAIVAPLLPLIILALLVWAVVRSFRPATA